MRTPRSAQPDRTDLASLLPTFPPCRCGPCRAIAPVFVNLAKENGDKMTFVKIDVDDNGSTADAAGIRAVPTFKSFVGGKLQREWSGAGSEQLKSVVEDMIAAP